MGFPAPRGVGEFGGVTVGRSSVVWTPRRAFPQIPSAGSWERSRYAIAVGSYTPAQGGRAGTSEAEGDPKPSGWSMDEFLIRPLD